MTTPTDQHDHGIDDVRAEVARARSAYWSWAALGPRERRAALLRWKRTLARRTDEFAGLIASETGKPLHDARAEVLVTLVHLNWAARNAHRVLVAPGALRCAVGPSAGTAGLPPAGGDRGDRAVELPALHADGLDRLRPRCG